MKSQQYQGSLTGLDTETRFIYCEDDRGEASGREIVLSFGAVTRG